MKSKRSGYFKKIGDALPKVLEKKFKKTNFIELSIIKNWKDIVGEEISKKSWPIKIIFTDSNNLNGKLSLKVERGWAMEIEYKNQEILENLNQFFGYKAISKINIIQDFKTYFKKGIKKINKEKSQINHSRNINNVKHLKLKKALKKLDKTLFKSK